MTTKGEVDKSPFLIVKNQQNNDVKLVVSPSSFQVGLTNSPASLTLTGQAIFQQGLTSNGLAVFNQGLQGSITNLSDGTSYLVAGSNVTITSASNGQITISSTAGGGGSGDVVGPSSATDNAIVRFDSTTGKLIQDSVVTIADTTGNITTPGDIAVNGGDITTTAGTATLFNTNATTLNIGGAATILNAGASTVLATIGQTELGAWPTNTAYAYFAHKDVTAATGYALLQNSSANTYLNAGSGGSVIIENAGNTIGTLDNNTISLTGQSGVATTTTIGNTAGASSTTIDAGTGNIDIGISNAARTTNIATGNAAQTVNIADGNTGKQTINIGTLHSNEADVRIGNYSSTPASSTRIYGDSIDIGTGGSPTITIGSAAGSVTFPGDIAVNGGDITTTAATFNLVNAATTINLGTTSVTRTINIGTNSTNVQTIKIGDGAAANSITIGSTTGAAALTLQSGTGDINLDSTNAIRFKYGGSTVGILNEGLFGTYNISFTGPSGTWTTTTVGNKSNANSATTIQGGSSVELTGVAATTYDIGDANTTGTITIGKSTASNFINIGNANSTGTQTINIGAGTPTGSGKAVITVGNKTGASATTIQAGSGDIELDSTGAIRFQQSNVTAGLITTGFGICSIDFSGPASTVTDTTIGSTYSSSSTDIDAGTGGITMTGEVMKPSQPCFLAYLDGGTQLITTTAGTITVEFNTERFDVGSDYSTGTYTFTAPRTGKYLFNVQLRLEDLDTAASYYYVSLITSNATYQLAIIDPNFSADLNYYWMAGSVVADMDASDTAYVVIRQNGGAANQTYIADENTAAQICSFFSGYFMG